jgi:hypothetical protein
MLQRSVPRSYAVGLAVGMIWLIVVSTFFAFWDVLSLGAWLPLAGVSLVGLVLLIACIVYLRAAQHLPRDTSPESVALRKKLGRRFGLVVLIEVVAIVIANSVCALTNQVDFIVPVDLLIVGIHFFPLAALFNVRSYYVMGMLWILIVIITMLTTSSTTIVGWGMSIWIVLPSIGCAVVTWLTVIYLLVENMHALRVARTSMETKG